MLEDIINWKVQLLTRNLFLLSSDNKYGAPSMISVKGTTIKASQLVCGPISGYQTPLKSEQESLFIEVPEIKHPKLNVRHGNIELLPHYTCFMLTAGLEATQRTSTVVPLGNVSGINSTGSPSKSVLLDSTSSMNQQLVILNDGRQVNVTVGPIIGCVTSTSANILLECDAEALIICKLTDRLTAETFQTKKATLKNKPVIFHMNGLRPGRVYNVLFEVRIYRNLSIDKIVRLMSV
jgi:hypothetical protein